MGSLAAAALLLGAGVEPILQLTCRDRNRIALQSDLLAAAALGIENLLLLRGDNPSAGDQPDAKPVFDLDTLTLSGVARDIRDGQKLMSGQKVSGKANFFIGAADSPIDPPAGWKPDRLKAKIDAGAQFAQTQFCMDPAVARRYAQRLAENGLGSFRLVIGLVPLRSARSARWIRENLPGSIVPDAIVARMEGAGDPVREGRRICDELVEQLSETPGSRGRAHHGARQRRRPRRGRRQRGADRPAAGAKARRRPGRRGSVGRLAAASAVTSADREASGTGRRRRAGRMPNSARLRRRGSPISGHALTGSRWESSRPWHGACNRSPAHVTSQILFANS